MNKENCALKLVDEIILTKFFMSLSLFSYFEFNKFVNEKAQ